MPIAPLAALLLISFVTPVRADTAPACAALLTAAEIEAAVGPGFVDLGAEESAPGVSSCPWLRDRRENPQAIVVDLTRKIALSGRTAEAFFDEHVARSETLHEQAHEDLKGLGVTRAALIPGKRPGAMMVLVLETRDGVARVETDALDREAVLALARAIGE